MSQNNCPFTWFQVSLVTDFLGSLNGHFAIVIRYRYSAFFPVFCSPSESTEEAKKAMEQCENFCISSFPVLLR